MEYSFICPGASRRQCNGRCQGGSVVLDCTGCNREERGEGGTNDGAQTADNMQQDGEENVVGIDTFIQTYYDGSASGNGGKMYCSCESDFSLRMYLQ